MPSFWGPKPNPNPNQQHEYSTINQQTSMVECSSYHILSKHPASNELLVSIYPCNWHHCLLVFSCYLHVAGCFQAFYCTVGIAFASSTFVIVG